MVDGPSDNKSDFVLLARLKQVARLWVTQLDQEAQHEDKEAMAEQLLKIVQDETQHAPGQMIAKDEREGMIVTLKYWYDLILLRRAFSRQMVLQNEQECGQNLKHWLHYCVGKKGRSAPSPVDVAQLEPLLATPPVSPLRSFGVWGGVTRNIGTAISLGGDTDTPTTTRTSHGESVDLLEQERESVEEKKLQVGSTNSAASGSRDGSGLKPAAKPDEVQTEEVRLMRSHNTLVALYHGKHCTCKHGQCKVFPHCTKAKALWKHASECSDGEACDYEHCRQSRLIMQHYLSCQRPSCVICGPVLMVLPKLKEDIEMQSKTPSPKAKRSSPERTAPDSSRKKQRQLRSTASCKSCSNDSDTAEHFELF